MMIAQDFQNLLTRDLDRLMSEIEAYHNEASLWLKADGINNSAGNLCLHLTGNLQYFIGSVLGNSGYERNRDFEFNGKVMIDDLKSEVKNTKKIIIDYFTQVSNDSLDEAYPLQPLGYEMTTAYFILHLLGHLNYHLGQINYHRRILSESSK